MIEQLESAKIRKTIVDWAKHDPKIQKITDDILDNFVANTKNDKISVDIFKQINGMISQEDIKLFYEYVLNSNISGTLEIINKIDTAKKMLKKKRD